MSSHLSLNAVESSEPEDLTTAQLSLSTVDLLLILGHLLAFVLPGLQAKPRLLQARQPLCGHRGDYLEAGCVRWLFDQEVLACRHSEHPVFISGAEGEQVPGNEHQKQPDTVLIHLHPHRLH